MNAYWIPDREWNGQDCFLIGGGPSLRRFDFQLLSGRNTIGCNDACRLGNDIIKIGCFGDLAWWMRQALPDLKEVFTNRLVTNAGLEGWDVPQLLKMKRVRDGLHDGDTLGWNYSTGAMAINLAISLGAQRIFLLGYDLCNSAAKESHWHKFNTTLTKDKAFERFMRGFLTIRKELPAGVEVLNVTDGTSRLTCFPFMDFQAFHDYLKLEVAA